MVEVDNVYDDMGAKRMSGNTMALIGRAETINKIPVEFQKRWPNAQARLDKLLKLKRPKTGMGMLSRLNEFKLAECIRDMAILEDRLEYLKSLDNEGGEIKC